MPTSQEQILNLAYEISRLDRRLQYTERRVRAVRAQNFVNQFKPGDLGEFGDVSTFLDFKEVAVPADPDSGWRRVFASSVTNKLSVRTSSSTTINLEYGDTEAIAAVEGEATLDLTGEVTIASGKSLTVKTDGSTGGVKFGASGDAILYRGAANVLYLGTGDSLKLVSGALDVIHTSTEDDDHALEIDVDAAAHGDVKALDIDYITGAIGAGDDEGVILINIDEIAAGSGSDIFGLEILATEGGSGIYGMKTGVGIGPIHQDSGTFITPTTGIDNGDDASAMYDDNPNTTTAIFEGVDEYIIIGAAAAFEELEFILATGSSGAGIKPTFAYSTGGANFTPFSPVDGTNGFRNTGVVAWDQSDLSGHAASSRGTYDIKITRTRVSLGTTPVLRYAKTASTTEYVWDEDGNVNLSSLEVVNFKFETPTEVTIDTNGDLAVTQAFHSVDTFSDASSDNLDGITGGADGEFLLIRPESDARTVIVRHNQNAAATKNILLSEGTSATLDDISDMLLLVYDASLDTNGAWVEISRTVAPAATHVLLDGGTIHTDTASDGVTEGSLILGNNTPAWDELVISVPAANVRNVLGVDNGETTASWKTALDATNPAAVAAAASAGTSLVFSHRDHAHKMGVITTKGDLLSWSTLPARLGVGANDTILMADSGQTTGLKWAAPASPSAGVDIGDAAAEGSADTWARSDHQHAFTAPGAGYPLDIANAEADGTATTPARADHVHAHPAGLTADLHHAKFTAGEAITAVEGEATLDLSGAVEITGILTVDVINEKTANIGVTVDGVVLKDGVVAVGDIAFDDATSDPLIDGVAADGVENSTARKDHVHPKHHDAITIGADAAHSLAGQVLSAVLAANGQVGHMSSAMYLKLLGIDVGADVTGDNPPQGHGFFVHTQYNTWKLLYTDGSGDEQELALGAAGTYIRSSAVNGAPTMSTIDADVAAAGAVMDSDISPGEGFLRKTGAGAYTAHKSNLSANAAPVAADDDADAGYSVGSIWIDTTNDNMYICVDSTNNAAVWLHLNAAAAAHKDSHDPIDGADPLDTAVPNRLTPDIAQAIGTGHEFSRADHEHQVTCDTPLEISVVIAGSEGTDSYNFARADHVHAINHAITDNHIVTVDGTTNSPVVLDYAKWTTLGLEGRTYAQVLSDLSAQAGAAFDWGGQDLSNIGAAALAGILTVDTINEKTGDAGVTFEGVKALDSFLEFSEIAIPSAPAASKGRIFTPLLTTNDSLTPGTDETGVYVRRNDGLMVKLSDDFPYSHKTRYVNQDDEPAFLNSWVNYSNTYRKAQFVKDFLGCVWVDGLIKSGTIGAAWLFLLPESYWNTGGWLRWASVSGTDALGILDLVSSGDAPQASVGNNAYFSLARMAFPETNRITWHEIGGGGEPAFENSWVNLAGGWDTAGFAKDAIGRVWIKGMVKDGDDNTAVFTLPAGYRPSAQIMLPIATNNNVIGRMEITAAGEVKVNLLGAGDHDWATISCVFTADGEATWHEVGGGGEPAFENSWVNNAFGYDTAAFYKDACGIVHTKGMVKDGTIGQTVFTLPVGYRPRAKLLLSALSNDAIGRIDIFSNGEVKAITGNNAWFSVHFSFVAEQ